MNRHSAIFFLLFIFLGVSLGHAAERTIAPESIVAGNGVLYIAETGANRITIFDSETDTVKKYIPLSAKPTGLALSPDSKKLFVTCAGGKGSLNFIDLNTNHVASQIQLGSGSRAPVVRSNGERVYVCNQFDNTLSIIDVEQHEEIKRIAIGREPYAAALTQDEAFLYVVHHLPAGPANREHVAANIKILHTAGLQTVKEISLPNGSTAVKDICLSPDGKYAFVVHLLSHYQLPTTQIEKGWMTTNALTVLDAANHRYIDTILLDSVDRGAGNPWAVACGAEGKQLAVAHAGTHEISLIDLPAMMETLDPDTRLASTASYVGQEKGTPVSSDLTFLTDLRHRIPTKGNGPRDVVMQGHTLYATNYFSDTLTRIFLAGGKRIHTNTIPLREGTEISIERRGEALFYNAAVCFQGWQSCASCHPGGRADGLNWDLLNDGIGNPKNTKSLLLSHQTPPAMSTGVRARAEVAVRKGFFHILFIERPEREEKAVDAYLKSMQPHPNPNLIDGRLSTAAQRGKKLFHSPLTECASCHKGEYFTDLKLYDVGTQGPLDRTGKFDNPTLIELWRTAPYLHDGRAATIKDVLTTFNLKDQHGKTSHLNESQIADLEAYLLSL
ncbi:hypothetical protein GF373_01715 [bacterium]|nr:hypothetical protein [bacterium]